jgi:aminoglycoside phosphotransferase (APT) family kinase protein
MSLPLAPPIAEGRTAEVYAWDAGHVLKLYREWCPPDWVEHEGRVAHAVTEANIPTPAAGEIVEVNGRRGLVYERVSGSSMLEDLNRHPWLMFRHARALAELHVPVNRLSIPGLPSCKGGLGHAIRNAPALPDDLRQRALLALEKLPEGHSLCHGDFHPGNVLLTAQGPIVLDWMTAKSGSPWADLARSSLLLTIGPKGAGNMISPALRLAIGLFHRLYLNRYQAIAPDEGGELGRWKAVTAAGRLAEQIEPEREALIEIVRIG